MKCPKCGKEMQPGFLQTNPETSIAWVDKLLPFGIGYWKNNAEIVSDVMNFSLNAVPTHICKDCKLFIGDYSGK